MSDQLHEIELHIDEARKQIAFAESLDRLRDNKDFVAVIEDGFFKDEAERVVALKADPNIQGENEQKQIDNIITSIGGLRQYLRTIGQLRNMAQSAIEAGEEARDEILIEELGVTEV